ncbi:hypothetical protein EV421DRAFT_522867 [Armillaria borealis]|uniref:Uncharacterized protein n=1 Tax=Armillaria borealis TaxID=47425 RepID=A0AA39JIS3_9AGAR|nr:hypothetical protein EV421DRAFT_522867 [Armillaria borealis]
MGEEPMFFCVTKVTHRSSSTGSDCQISSSQNDGGETRKTRIASGQAWTESQKTPGVNTDLRQYFSMASSSHFHDSHRGTNMLYGYSRPYNSRTRSPVGYSMERASSRLNRFSDLMHIFTFVCPCRLQRIREHGLGHKKCWVVCDLVSSTAASSTWRPQSTPRELLDMVLAALGYIGMLSRLAISWHAKSVHLTGDRVCL